MIIMALFIVGMLTIPAITAYAEGTIDVGSGLAAVEQDALAQKILDIFTGIGYFIGVVAVGSLIFNAFQLATGDERKRADAKTHVLWTLGAIVLVGLALLIVGFVVGLLA